MGLKSFLLDGLGSGRKATVTKEHGLLTHALPYPPMGEQKVIPFRQYLTLDGTQAGTSNMKTVGTLAAPVSYFVPAAQDADRYITQVSFLIADVNSALNVFGAVAALTNGCRFYYQRIDRDVVFHEALKTNFDFVRMCLFNPAFGASTDVFEAANVASGSEGYVPTLNFLNIIPPFGIKLDMGTMQRLVLEVRDTTTGVDAFNAIAYGFDRLNGD